MGRSVTVDPDAKWRREAARGQEKRLSPGSNSAGE